MLLLWIVIQIPAVQNYAKNKILSSLSEKYEAEWSIEDIKIKFIDEIAATGILFKDQQGDTLFAAEKLRLDIGLFSFLRKEILINDLVADNAYIGIHEFSDGTMNFDFLIPSDDNETSSSEEHRSEWTFGLQDIILNNTDYLYSTPSLKISAKQKLLHIDINNLDIINQKIDIEEFVSEGKNIDITQSSSKNQSSSFSLPDIGWQINLKKTKFENEKIRLRTDTAEEINDVKVSLEDMTYDGDSLSLKISQVKGNYNNLINLSEAYAEVYLKGDQLSLKKLNVKSQYDKVNINNLDILLNDNTYNASQVNINLSYKSIKTFKKYIPQNINIIAKQDLRLMADKLSIMPESLKAKKIDLKYGSSINLAGSGYIDYKKKKYQSLRKLN